MPQKIDHVGIAVKSIDEMLKFYSTAMGLEMVEIEEVPSQKVKIAMLSIGQSRIELLQPTSEESPIAKFINRKGTGIHHLAINVEDIEKMLTDLKNKGVHLINEKPIYGAEEKLVAFIHPSSTGGVLIELCQDK